MSQPTKEAIDWNLFEALSEESAQAIVWASQGLEGSGKSAFCLSAPGPVFVCAFDPFGMNRVDKKFKAGKDIRIKRYGFNPNVYKDPKDVAKNASELWNRFIDEYRVSLKNVRTVIWDREDMAYKLQRYANFGDTSSAPKEYEDLYIDYVALIQEAYEAGVNLGLIRGMKEKWVSKFDAAKGKMVGHNTGEYIPDGMKKIPDCVDIVLWHRWDEEQKAYMTKFGKFTNPEYRGQEFQNLDWPTMAMSAYPETNPDCWT